MIALVPMRGGMNAERPPGWTVRPRSIAVQGQDPNECLCPACVDAEKLAQLQ
jgi:hypothetical protein